MYLGIVVLYQASIMGRKPRSPPCYKMHCSMVPIALQHCSMENNFIAPYSYQSSTCDSVLFLFPLAPGIPGVHTVSSPVFWCTYLRLASCFRDYPTGLYYGTLYPTGLYYGTLGPQFAISSPFQELHYESTRSDPVHILATTVLDR